jgi:hypothetical protein
MAQDYPGAGLRAQDFIGMIGWPMQMEDDDA